MTWRTQKVCDIHHVTPKVFCSGHVTPPSVLYWLCDSPKCAILVMWPKKCATVCNSYTMPTRFLSSIIHKVISVRPEGIAWKSNGYYWVCNWRYKLGRYGIICLYHATVHLTVIDIYNLQHWKLIHCIDMSMCKFSFCFCRPVNYISLKRRCLLTSKHNSFVLFLRYCSIYIRTITIVLRRVRVKTTKNNSWFCHS